jgi:hypothetical protein
MSISELFPTGLHEQNIGHYATIVRLALLDEKIDENELKLLKKLAKSLDISKEEYKAILKNPLKYPVTPPISYDDRLERLFDLTRMLFMDRNPTIDKVSMMNRIAIGLGFPLETAIKTVQASINFFLKEPDVEDFKKAIKSSIKL